MNIKFKKIADVEFDKIFPIISKEDYLILEGNEMVIDQATVDKLEKNNYLEIGNYQISKDLIDIITQPGQSQMQTTIQEIVDEKFIFSNDVVDVLVTGIETGRNVLLWGRGGHGKSEITELVLKALHKLGYLDEEPFIQAFGDGLTEEKLFGGMNIIKYKEKGVIEYLPENSFMNHKIVVFEEIFDAPASVLLSLKDIMTSKKFRQGNEVFDVKTEIIIGLTNRSKREFSDKDDSLAALAERFALTLKVEWTSYTKRNFIKLFKKVYGDEYYVKHHNKLNTLANIIELNNQDGTSFVSPRTAVAAADVFVRGKNLAYISEIDEDILKKYENTIIEEQRTVEQEQLITNINAYIANNNLEQIDHSEQFLKDLNAIEEEIGGKPINFDDIINTKDNSKEVKLNKCNYLLAIIDRQSPTKRTFNNFSNLKKKLKGIINGIS